MKNKESLKLAEITYFVAKEFCGNSTGFEKWFKEEVVAEFNDRFKK